MSRELAIPALAALGLADSTYLAVLHWRGEIPPCGGYSGCAAVNSSPYAEVFGVPVAALGAGLFALLLAIGLWRTRLSSERRGQATHLLYGLAVSGGVFVTYLTAIELFVLHDVCYWCLALAVISYLVLGLATGDVLALGTARAEWSGRPRSRLPVG